MTVSQILIKAFYAGLLFGGTLVLSLILTYIYKEYLERQEQKRYLKEDYPDDLIDGALRSGDYEMQG